MIKRLMRIWFTIAMYELGKWIGREIISLPHMIVSKYLKIFMKRTIK